MYSAISYHLDSSKCFTFYPMTDLFSQTPTQLLPEAFSHAAVNTQTMYLHEYRQLSEVDQCWLNVVCFSLTLILCCLTKYNPVADYLFRNMSSFLILFIWGIWTWEKYSFVISFFQIEMIDWHDYAKIEADAKRTGKFHEKTFNCVQFNNVI